VHQSFAIENQLIDLMLARDIEANMKKMGNSTVFDRLGQSTDSHKISDTSSCMVFSVVDKSSTNGQKEKNRLTKAKKDQLKSMLKLENKVRQTTY
jgi:hypothetical protein